MNKTCRYITVILVNKMFCCDYKAKLKICIRLILILPVLEQWFRIEWFLLSQTTLFYIEYGCKTGDNVKYIPIF